ncbi:expressed unknown protein [Ectocarpus siliculosus]|uniref:Uncharacterized protein n=1 Tax=Ectocarpus siliculosus TaxID=2880 RepID=D8LIX6_ECTSI|nr:expressed unknown protein [Ectocarpus siliculosus]|eukprot:CBN76860.1 expressed unknown protein [Ectocarpus siliculosus]
MIWLMSTVGRGHEHASLPGSFSRRHKSMIARSGKIERAPCSRAWFACCP